ncbi:hypothetical protein ACVSQB_17320 [Bradyrhizobium elkanii]
MATEIPTVAGTGQDNAAILSERLRIGAILDSPEGKRNPELARELALRSTLDVDTAKSLLGKAPAANPYLQAMELEGKVGLTAATPDFSNDPKAARLQEIKQSVSAFNVEKGWVPKDGAGA